MNATSTPKAMITSCLLPSLHVSVDTPHAAGPEIFRAAAAVLRARPWLLLQILPNFLFGDLRQLEANPEYLRQIYGPKLASFEAAIKTTASIDFALLEILLKVLVGIAICVTALASILTIVTQANFVLALYVIGLVTAGMALACMLRTNRLVRRFRQNVVRSPRS